MTTTLWIIILCGAGTFLLRFLPIWQHRRKASTRATSGALHRFLQGIGPAAITALLAVSLWPMLTISMGRGLATVAALIVIVLVKRKIGGIAVPTLTGAVIYGLLMHFSDI